MTDYEALMEAVREEMGEPEMTAELQIERRCDAVIRDLDELCAMAANRETVDLVEGQRIAVGQILVRAQLVASFLMARHPSKLRIVQNG